MDFSFSEDQVAIRELAYQIFTDRSTDAFQLEFSRTDQAYDDSLWTTLAEQGLLGIGYHFIITIDGDVKKGRHVDQIGFNLDDDKGETIGIALVGHKKFNELQTKALNKLVNDLILKYGQLQIKSTIRELGI